MKNLKKILSVFIGILVFMSSSAQDRDSIAPIRDNIGDMNEDAIKKGEFPGAIKIPGTDVSLAIGGFIKAVALYDTKYNVKNEIILPGTFTSSDIYKGQTYMGAKSSRLYFDGRATLGHFNIRGYYEMDFRGSAGFTLRHAYLQLTTAKGQKLLMGQYWSLVMDLPGIPEGLVEPTTSGAGFSRHGQIRFSTPLSKALTLSASLEDPNNSDLRGTDINPLDKYPDVVASLSIDPSNAFHLSLTGMYRPLSYTNSIDDKTKTATGYYSNMTVVIKPGANDKIALSGMYAEGASNYVMGADATAGFYENNNLELQTQYGGYFSYRHLWNDKFRSNFVIGRFMTDKIENNANPHIKSSTYGFINTYYKLNKYVNMGVEWIYTEKDNYNGGVLNNNRFQFGIQIF